MESQSTGFPPFPHSLEIPSGFPHSHGHGYDEIHREYARVQRRNIRRGAHGLRAKLRPSRPERLARSSRRSAADRRPRSALSTRRRQSPLWLRRNRPAPHLARASTAQTPTCRRSSTAARVPSRWCSRRYSCARLATSRGCAWSCTLLLRPLLILLKDGIDDPCQAAARRHLPSTRVAHRARAYSSTVYMPPVFHRSQIFPPATNLLRYPQSPHAP
jgi:hypothetical protein